MNDTQNGQQAADVFTPKADTGLAVDAVADSGQRPRQSQHPSIRSGLDQ